jgi:hypothetical protein
MLPGDWTAELGRERMAELHRQAEHQRLVCLARAQRRDGTSGVACGRRWGWLRVGDEVRVRAPWNPRPRRQQRDRRRRHELVMTGPTVGVDVADTPSTRPGRPHRGAGYGPAERTASSPSRARRPWPR